MSTMPMRKSMCLVAIATVLLLLIPAIAMQVTPEVSWGAEDFLAAGVLLFGAGTLVALVLRYVTGRVGRAALIFAVACVLALVWAELAVGLFD